MMIRGRLLSESIHRPPCLQTLPCLMLQPPTRLADGPLDALQSSIQLNAGKRFAQAKSGWLHLCRVPQKYCCICGDEDNCCACLTLDQTSRFDAAHCPLKLDIHEDNVRTILFR